MARSTRIRILGIDPGTATTGFGVIDSQGQNYKLVDGGVIRTLPKDSDQQRLLAIYDNLSSIIRQHKPAHVAVEQLFFAQNVTTAMTVSQARGVVLLAVAKASLPHSEYTPLQIKQALTGYGRADKAQVQEMVKVLLKLRQTPKPDDCADALAAAICHAMTAVNRQPV